MITSLRLVDFKNFRDETLSLGACTVIVGANATGKSNLRDAFRFLHGIGRGYTLAEIIGGKYGAGGQEEWQAIRGHAHELARFGQTGFSLQVSLRLDCVEAQYSIEVSARPEFNGGYSVVREELQIDNERVFSSHPGGSDPVNEQQDDFHLLVRMARNQSQRKYGHRIAVRPTQPALTQIHEHRNVLRAHKDRAAQVIDRLADMRFLDPVPEQMRQPAFPGQTVLGDSGENLATVLQALCEDPLLKKNLTSWTRELTPMDIQDFAFPQDSLTGRVQMAICEHSDRRVSAFSAYDGTLRFLAMLAALLGTQPAGLYFFEEIDNGIHPSRLHLLLDLLECQTAERSVQVVTTTHSPDMLNFVDDHTFQNTSVVARVPDTADAIIRPLRELPDAETLREKQGLGRLHASGWMEDILYFLHEEERVS